MKKPNFKKEFKEWGVIAIILLTLYFTGLHTNIAAFAQRMILSVGLITPNTELEADEIRDVDYNLLMEDLEGNQISLADYKGKVIFINLWATWCPPCIAEMPGIQELYSETDHENVVFVMLSLDKDFNRARKFVKKKAYDFPVYKPVGNVPELFRAPSIPTTYVISKEGKVVSTKVGMAKYNTKSFKKFLAKQVEK